jgi:putative FmdB family regulatory protein
MPVYEYRCNSCGRKVTIYIQGFSEQPAATCPECGSPDVTRLPSRFSLRKGYQAVYEDILSDSQLVSGMERNDPRALAEWSRKMGDMTGETQPEYKDMVGRLERGESYEQVISDMQRETGMFSDEEGSE